MPKNEKSFNYWKKRELANQLNQIKDEKVIASKMKDNYTDALNDIEHQINVFYERYAGSQGISIEEATKRVSEHDVKAFEKKAKQYVKDKDFSPKANAELKLYNATMRINRFELLKSEINLRLADVTNENEAIIGEYLEKLGMNEYARQAGILDREIRFSKEAVKAVVHGDYKYGDFSSNIWTNHEKLINNLGIILRRSMIQGSNPTTMIGRLRKEFDVSHYEAKRLLVTEAARVQGDIQIDAFEQSGYDSYTYIAELTACDICAKLDGEHFSIEEREVGVNYYPMHPFCKCSSSPYFDRSELDKEVEIDKEKVYNKGVKEAGALYGAWNDKNDPTGEKRDEHAEKYYKAVRKRDKDIEIDTIAKNTGYRINEISKIYEHIFINKHRFRDGRYERFDEDYHMANSWARLREGKNIRERDLILLEHEMFELSLMDIYGYVYEDAHEITEKIYDYSTLIREEQ